MCIQGFDGKSWRKEIIWKELGLYERLAWTWILQKWGQRGLDRAITGLSWRGLWTWLFLKTWGICWRLKKRYILKRDPTPGCGWLVFALSFFRLLSKYWISSTSSDSVHFRRTIVNVKYISLSSTSSLPNMFQSCTYLASQATDDSRNTRGSSCEVNVNKPSSRQNILVKLSNYQIL